MFEIYFTVVDIYVRNESLNVQNMITIAYKWFQIWNMIY